MELLWNLASPIAGAYPSAGSCLALGPRGRPCTRRGSAPAREPLARSHRACPVLTSRPVRDAQHSVAKGDTSLNGRHDAAAVRAERRVCSRAQSPAMIALHALGSRVLSPPAKRGPAARAVAWVAFRAGRQPQRPSSTGSPLGARSARWAGVARGSSALGDGSEQHARAPLARPPRRRGCLAGHGWAQPAMADARAWKPGSLACATRVSR